MPLLPHGNLGFLAQSKRNKMLTQLNFPNECFLNKITEVVQTTKMELLQVLNYLELDSGNHIHVRPLDSGHPNIALMNNKKAF